MHKPIEIVVWQCRLIVVGALLFSAVSVALEDNADSDELQGCASIDAASERLACYDNVVGRQEPKQMNASAPPEPVPDDFGSETLRGKDQEEDEKPSVQARVIKCTKNSLNKNFYYLDNGQIWKQVSDKRVNVKECDFMVTVTKDMFGYKMRRDGDKGQIRISRIK